ncbi:MAG: PilZ domain-containing protein [Pseudomonadota bacterium]
MPGSFSSLARWPLGGVPLVNPAPDAFMEPLRNVGRRKAARLRLSIPAKLVTVSETRRCVLIDLSRTGAQIALPKPLQVGDAAFLRFAGFDVFASALRCDQGRNGLEFDMELSDADVIAIRHYAESAEADERRALIDEARAWVMGSGKA